MIGDLPRSVPESADDLNGAQHTAAIETRFGIERFGIAGDRRGLQSESGAAGCGRRISELGAVGLGLAVLLPAAGRSGGGICGAVSGRGRNLSVDEEDPGRSARISERLVLL